MAALATALLGLEANRRRGDDLRALLWHRTRALLEHLDKLGVATSNTSGFPRNETGFRIQLTTANTAEQVDHLLTVLEELHDRFGFRRPTPEAVAPLPTAFAPLTRLSNTSSIS